MVTVAVQTTAGSAAIVSAFPALSGIPVIGPKILLVISVVAILAMCLGNLRGIREAGRIIALPTCSRSSPSSLVGAAAAR